MPNDMGTFRVDMELENPAKPGVKRTVRSVLVDTGAELSWVPTEVLESLGVERNNQWRFRQANGTVLQRWTGTVSVYVAGKRAGDEVVFGEPGDLTLLGSRTLEGLNFRVEPSRSSSSTQGRLPRQCWSREIEPIPPSCPLRSLLPHHSPEARRGALAPARDFWPAPTPQRQGHGIVTRRHLTVPTTLGDLA